MRPFLRNAFAASSLLFASTALIAPSLSAQSAGNAGTISGTVTDPAGAVVPNATVVLRNSVSGYDQTRVASADGSFQFTNIPSNTYRLFISAPGFSTRDIRIDIRSSVPVPVKAVMQISAANEVVSVEAGGDLVETSSVAHTDIDRQLFAKLPLESQSSALSSLLTLAAPGVAADSNGLLHGLGDHAENAFYVDGQPITDQQSKVFSNQLPLAAIESLEVIEGAPPAEYGEKTSLVAVITTRSGQGSSRPHGQVTASYGSFGSSFLGGDFSIGSKRFGNFIAADGLQTGRFLDPSEFAVFHDKGNEANVFDRVDFQPNAKNAFHMNADYTRSWFQTPNSYDSLGVMDFNGNVLGNTDQRSKIGTLLLAPQVTHTISDDSNVTLGLFMRRDHYNYYPSRNPLADFGPNQQQSVSQDRSLTNAGARLDYVHVHGIHNIKFGGTYQQTFLNERFTLGLVNPTFNSPCIDATGASVPGFNDPAQCVAAGLQPNTAANPNAANPFNPLLACLDLTRPNPAASSGCATTLATPFLFRGTTDVKLASLYGQDSITLGHFNINIGIRGDLYNGFSSERQAEPRAGVAYNIAKTATVLRISYARSLETPFNENLVLDVQGCTSTIISLIVPCVPATLNPGFRNEFHAGFEQGIGKHLVVNADYLWKYTHNGYDFSVLGSTPITFPIAWKNSKISGFALRAAVPNYRGFTAFVVMSSVAARFFHPQIGGLGQTDTSSGAFRIDHDQKFSQTTNVQYQYKRGPFMSFNWRYDSGLVAGAVPFATDNTTPVDLTGLTADQQTQAGLQCGNVSATLTNALTTCAPNLYHSSLISLPAPGTQDPDHNPARISPRNLFDLSLGDDHILRFKDEAHTIGATLTVVNLTNRVALYNFLSTFSGTHYVTPRAITGQVTYHF